MNDLLLTAAHHLLAFAIVVVLSAEVALVREGLTARTVRVAGLLDASYGALAALILVVGFLRVFYGLKVPEFYLQNPLFWAKIGAFGAVGLLSVPPTIQILRWRRRLKFDQSYLPPAGDIRHVRLYFFAEAIVFIPIPVLAAAMGRGYGL